MSQSATLYSISKEKFYEIENAGINNFDIYTAKSYALFQGSFMAIEYILGKNQPDQIIKMIAEIFNPTDFFGKEQFDKFSDEEKMNYFENNIQIKYLTANKISLVNKFLSTISTDEIHLKYNAKELNDNEIYPYAWHNNNSPDDAFNEHRIQKDINNLKEIFTAADKESDLLLVFVG